MAGEIIPESRATSVGISSTRVRLCGELFYDGMQKLGWVEHVNVAYERRFAGGQWEHLPDLARDLDSTNPNVIVIASTAPALAAKKATSTTPIVVLDPGDPVAAGLVTSLARPNGNITGVSSMAPDLAAKQLEILHEAVPTATRISMLFNAALPPSEIALKEMIAVAARFGIELLPTPIRGTGSLDEALGQLDRTAANGILVFADPLTHSHAKVIVAFAAARRLPVLYANRIFVDAGGLLSYGPNYRDMFRRGAYYVDKILKGTKPADLPVEQPTKFDLVINLKTAKACDLTIPSSILARADEVIE